MMTQRELIDDFFRLKAEHDKFLRLGLDAEARLIACDLEVIADRLGWNT